MIKLRPFVCAVALLSLAAPASAQVSPRPPKDELEKGVDRALEFLQRMQDKDGSWSHGRDKSVALTSLAMMSYLSAGHMLGEGPYGEVLERGTKWILQQQRPNGVFMNDSTGPEMYHHGIATILLSQLIGMVPEGDAKPLRAALEKAVSVIVRSQVKGRGQADGGWRYRIDSYDADLSVTGWQVMALRGARNVGCDVPAETIKNALAYVERSRDPIGGGYCYIPGWAPSLACTGTALLVNELSGKTESRPRESLLAGSYILKTPFDRQHNHFYYAAYYTSQGMFQLGRNYWNAFRPVLHKQLLSTQDPNGAWQDPNTASPVYATSMAVLALTVEYRLLPIYQKDEGR